MLYIEVRGLMTNVDPDFRPDRGGADQAFSIRFYVAIFFLRFFLRFFVFFFSRVFCVFLCSLFSFFPRFVPVFSPRFFVWFPPVFVLLVFFAANVETELL